MTFLQTVAAGLVVAVGGYYATQYLDRPSGLTADITPLKHVNTIPPRTAGEPSMVADLNTILDKTRFQPDKPMLERLNARAQAHDLAAFVSKSAGCTQLVRITNGVGKPVRNVRVTAENLIAFLDPVTTTLTAASSPIVIADLDPGAAKTVVLFTRMDCDNEYGIHDEVRVFNDDGTARVRTITMPAGFLVLINEYWFIAYPLLLVGLLVLVGAIINGIIEATKKVPTTTTPTPTSTSA